MEVTEKEKNLFEGCKVLDVVDGGMARIYHLLNLEENKRLVAKVLRPEFVKSRRHYEKFLEEGRLAMSLETHPMLVRAFAFVTDYEQPFLIMDWVDGWSLADWCAHGRQVV